MRLIGKIVCHYNACRSKKARNLLLKTVLKDKINIFQYEDINEEGLGIINSHIKIQILSLSIFSNLFAIAKEILL